MPVNLSIKNVPDALAEALRARAERNHRSLQGELMAMLEDATSGQNRGRADASPARYENETSTSGPSQPDRLLERLRAIAGERGIDTTKRLTREQTHNRTQLRKAGV